MKKLVALSAAFFVAAVVAMAQPPAEPPGGPDPGGPDPLNPLALPVDGGIGFLLAAGASFGARRIKAMNAAKAE